MEEACRAASDGVMARAKEDGGLMNGLMALMEQAESGKMLEFYGETMPKESSLAKRERWVY